MRWLGIKYISLVYVESVCRVETISLSGAHAPARRDARRRHSRRVPPRRTGKIMIRFADHLLVQWPELTKKYPRAQYIGRLC